MAEFVIDWTELKTRVDNRGLSLQYLEDDNAYTLWAEEGPQVMYRVKLFKDGNADTVDFETNYQSGANAPNPFLIKQPIDTNATLVGGTSSRYRPRVIATEANLSIPTSPDTTIVSQNVDGKLDAFTMRFNTEFVEVILNVDSTEIFRLELNDLDRTNGYNLGSGGGTPAALFPIHLSQGGLQIMYQPVKPVDVLTNFTIEANANTGGALKLMHMVLYREMV